MTRVLYVHDFLIYFLSVYEKWPGMCVSSLRESVSFIWRERVLSKKCSCFIRAVGVWSEGLLFARSEGGRQASEIQASKEGV